MQSRQLARQIWIVGDERSAAGQIRWGYVRQEQVEQLEILPLLAPHRSQQALQPEDGFTRVHLLDKVLG